MMSNDRVASLLTDVAKRCRDSEEGYRRAAEDTHDGELRQQLRQLSSERSNMADELDALIRQYGGEPPARGGTLLGAAHRMFTDIKAAISRDDRKAVLEEVARGESAAEESYDAVKREDLPQDVKETIQRHHERVRATRDRYRQMSGMMHTGSGVVAAAWQGPRAVGEMMHDRPILGASMAFFLGMAAGAALMSAFHRSMEAGYGAGGRSHGRSHSYRY
jgi:uncharacterized protein (TIGR02284 family)